jgi:hypothetical protein
MEVNPRHYRRPDQQWKCGLASNGQGCAGGPDGRGNCEQQVCSPRRTLQWWRSYLPVALATVTAGTLFVLYQTGRDRDALAPGPLTSVHAQLIHNPDDPHRCASCHDVQGDRLSSIGDVRWNNKSIAAHSQTERCLACHARDLPRMKLASAHDLPKQELENLSSQASKRTPVPSGLLISFTRSSPIDWHTHSLACGDCHREHQGPNHDLQAISSQRCQACHQNQFRSFAVDHPEFRVYPRPSSQSVAFNHLRHRDLHFSKSNTSFDCRTCHVNDSENGRVGQVFRSTSFEKACASCHQAGISSSLPDGLVVFQLPSVDAAGLKKLGADIGTWPEEASQILEGTIPSMMQWLLAGDATDSKVLETLPSSGKLVDFDLKVEADRAAIVKLVQASKHLLGELAQNGQKSIQARLGMNGLSPANSTVRELLRGVPPDLFRQAYREWCETSPVKSSTREIYTASKDTSNLLSSEKANRSNERLANSDLIESLPSKLNPPDNIDSRSWKNLGARQHLPAGGWMIDRQRMAIVYVPSGHADPWLTSFLTLGHSRVLENQKSTNTGEAVRSKFAKQFIDECLQATSLGRCAECHQSLSKFTDAKVTTELWQAKRFDARVRELTRFNHGPHLIQSGLQDCKSCHHLNDADPQKMETANALDDSLIHPDFASIRRSDCASCHRPNAAGDHCTQCHNYHTNAID